jgi:PAS domain-containing protein
MFDSAPRDPALVSDLLTWCSQLLEADAAVVCWSDDDGLHVLSVAEQDGARAEERLLPPEHPLVIVLIDTQRGSGEVGEIAEPMSRGMIEDLGRYIAVPLALPASADGGALIALTGEREAGEDAAETLTMVARVISRELAGIQRHRDTDNLRSMVDLASNSFLVLDVTGRITFANEANRGILGYGPEELAGNRAFAFVHPDDLSRVTTHFDSVVQTPGVSNPIE